MAAPMAAAVEGAAADAAAEAAMGYVEGIQASIRRFVTSFTTNSTMVETAEKIRDFIENNYVPIFAFMAAWSLLSNPLPFLVGFAVGIWAHDKEFVVNSLVPEQSNEPTIIVLKPSEYFSDEQRKSTFIMVGLATRLIVSTDISAIGFGILTGSFVRRLFGSNVSAEAPVAAAREGEGEAAAPAAVDSVEGAGEGQNEGRDGSSYVASAAQ